VNVVIEQFKNGIRIRNCRIQSVPSKKLKSRDSPYLTVRIEDCFSYAPEKVVRGRMNCVNTFNVHMSNERRISVS